jgi:hypothetical protein
MNTISARRRLYAAIVLPFVLLLAGCGRFHADIEVADVDTLNISYDLGITSDLISSEYDSADAMCEDMQAEEDSFGSVEVTAYDEDGLWGCRASGTLDRSKFGEDFTLTEENGEYHFVMDVGDAAISEEDLTALYGDEAADFDFRMTFTFPGTVLESQGGTVDGKTVEYTSISDLSGGVDITAKSGGFPWLIVIIVVLVLGFLLLLLLAVVAFFVIRSRRAKKNGSSGPGGVSVPAAFGGAAGAASMPSGNAPPAAPQWGQSTPPPPAGPSGGQAPQWGQSSPPQAPPQGGQQWGQPGQPGQGQPGQPGQNPHGGNQPPQGPGW